MKFLGNVVLYHRGLGSTDEDATLEERSEKILYFHPSNWSVEKQLHLVDSIETYQQLIEQFSEQPCHTVMLQDEVFALAQVEPEVWLVISRTSNQPDTPSQPTPNSRQLTSRIGHAMSALIPSTSSSSSTAGSATSKQATSGAVPMNHSKHEELTTLLPHTILDEIYSIIQLLVGPLNAILENGDALSNIKSLRKQIRKLRNVQESVSGRKPTDEEALALSSKGALELELSNYEKKSPTERIRRMIAPIMRMVLPSIDFAMLSSLSSYGYLTPLPLEQGSFLSVQYFMQLCTGKFQPWLSSCALLYCDHVVWSDVRDNAMRTITKVLGITRETSALLQDTNANPHLHEFVHSANGSVQQPNPHRHNFDSTFLDFASVIGSSNPIDAEALFGNEPQDGLAPRIWIKGSTVQQHLMVFVQGYTQVVLLVNCPAESSDTKLGKESNRKFLQTCRSRFATFAASELDRLSQAIYAGHLSVSKAKPSPGPIRTLGGAVSFATPNSTTVASSSQSYTSANSRYIYIDTASHTMVLSAALQQYLARDPAYHAAAAVKYQSGNSGNKDESSGKSTSQLGTAASSLAGYRPTGLMGFAGNPTSVHKGIAPPILCSSLVRSLGRSYVKTIELVLCALATHDRVTSDDATQVTEVMLQTYPKSKSSSEDVAWVVGCRTLSRYLIMLVDSRMAIPEVGTLFEKLKSESFPQVLL